ncbi:MAG: HPr family phosphocarrier protein [Kiritimatiellaeota bacterium]|nr:HPr family phosphocarrier protein [Kiritimatiellota bacterium]
MFSRTATVRNRYGIHCRPSALIVQAARQYPGEIRVTGPSGRTENAANLLGLISMAIRCGETVTVEVEGPDEEQTCAKMVELFEKDFDFAR